jgi:hypothetical protein
MSDAVDPLSTPLGALAGRHSLAHRSRSLPRRDPPPASSLSLGGQAQLSKCGPVDLEVRRSELYAVVASLAWEQPGDDVDDGPPSAAVQQLEAVRRRVLGLAFLRPGTQARASGRVPPVAARNAQCAGWLADAPTGPTAPDLRGRMRASPPSSRHAFSAGRRVTMDTRE